jgi:hypothetical protein
MDKDKNKLLMQALKERLMQRRLQNAPSPMGEVDEPDSEYGEMGYQPEPEVRGEPTSDMDGDFYNVIRKFSEQTEMEREEDTPPPPPREQSQYQQLLNLFNKGTKQ